MSESVALVLVLLVVGVLMLTWLAFRVRAAPDDDAHTVSSPAASLGMSVGMVLGAVLGAIVWLSTGHFVFWVIFMGGGMTAGLAIGSSYSSRAP
jgi:hypothetical protein